MSLNPSEMSELFGTDTNIRVGSLAAVSSRTAGSKRFPQSGGTLKSGVSSMNDRGPTLSSAFESSASPSDINSSVLSVRLDWPKW